MKLVLLLLLMQSASALAQDGHELPAISTNSKDFYIPASIYTKYKLKDGRADEWMKVYDGPANDSGIQRVADIRWQAKNKTEATQWYKDNITTLAEGGEDLTSQLSKPVVVDSWNVYGQSKETKDLLKSIGIEQNHYNFIFTVDKYVAKIFIATSAKQTLKDAWQLAKEGLKATLIAAGKPELAKQVI